MRRSGLTGWLVLQVLACAPGEVVMNASIRDETFGSLPNGHAVHAYTLANPSGVEVEIITYGAIITRILTPDRDGALGDIVLGYDHLGGYVTDSPYFGAVVGRYGNRIARGRFTLDGAEYQLVNNDGVNHLHGGEQGFDKAVWRAESVQAGDTVRLILTHTSPDGDQGYPGTLRARVTYTLTADNRLAVDYQATTDRATPVNLTQHTYFNLAGNAGRDILDHELTISASRYTPVDATLIPSGALDRVDGTPFDFREAAAIGSRIGADHPQLERGGGYDHNFVLDRPGDALGLAARVRDPATGRVLEVLTSEPGLQFYTGNFLDGSITGKGGQVYGHRWGFCLETQHYPDSPNHPGFPSAIVRPDTPYRSRTVFAFSTDQPGARRD